MKSTAPDSRNDNRPTARGRYEPPTRRDLAGQIPNLHMCDPRVEILIRELTQGAVSEDRRMHAWPTLCSLLTCSEFNGFGIVSNAYLDFLEAEATAQNLPFQRTLVLCMEAHANPSIPLYAHLPFFLRTLHVDKILVRASGTHSARSGQPLPCCAAVHKAGDRTRHQNNADLTRTGGQRLCVQPVGAA